MSKAESVSRTHSRRMSYVGTHRVGPRLSGRGRVLGDADDRATHVDAVEGLDGMLGIAVREVLDDTISIESAPQALQGSNTRLDDSPLRRVAPRDLRVVHIARGSGKVLQVL